MDESSKILTRATEKFLRAEKDHRAAMLDCGRLIHEFVIAHLERGTDMKERERQSHGYTRAGAVELVAESFGVEVHRVHKILSSAMVVSLLSDAGEIGNLGLRSLYYFGVLIQRKSCGAENHTYGIGAVPPVEIEEWVIKPGLEESAVALFRRAVAEEWGQDKSEVECRKLFRSLEHPRNHSKPRKPKTYRSHDEIADRAGINPSVAAPGDVAEYCLDLIRKSADPWQVAQRLMTELAKIAKPRLKGIA